VKPAPVGRPPRGKKAATHQVSLRLTDAELRAYTKAAKTLEMTISGFLRAAARALIGE
jgi:hypothetical protein